MAPQDSWLRQLGLRPREWADPVEDLEPLSLDERQRSRLLRDQLARGGHDPTPPDWSRIWRGRGLAPPLTAGELEGEALGQPLVVASAAADSAWGNPAASSIAGSPAPSTTPWRRSSTGAAINWSWFTPPRHAPPTGSISGCGSCWRPPAVILRGRRS